MRVSSSPRVSRLIGVASLVLLASLTTSSSALSVLTISGRVFSMRGEALANAYVRHASAGAYTDASGSYSLPITQPGCYLVTASGPSAPSGAYFETSRNICAGVQGATGQDFRVPYQLYGEAVPGFLDSLEDRVVSQSAAIFCPPDACAVSAQLYRKPFGGDLSTLGEFVGSVVLAYEQTDADGLAHYRGDIPIAAGTMPGWYQVVREARDPATNELQSRCMFDRCWNYFAVDNVAPRLGTASPQGWIRTASPTIRVPFTDEQDVGIDLASVQLALDGQPIPSSQLLLEGSPWSGAVTYQPAGLIDGIHTVSFQVADRAGNVVALAGFTFFVDTSKPTVSGPTPTGTIGDCCPRISARVADATGQINPDSIVLTLTKGLVSNRLAHSFDPASGEVAYQVPADVQGPGLGQFPLAGGKYSVRLTLTDMAGNALDFSWSFKVATTPAGAAGWVRALTPLGVQRFRYGGMS